MIKVPNEKSYQMFVTTYTKKARPRYCLALTLFNVMAAVTKNL